MPLNISARIVSDAVILDLSGRFSAAEDSLRELVNALLDEGRLNFLFNMAGVPYLGTWGLTEMILMRTAICQRGGTMGLVAPIQRVREVLKITKLDAVFPIYENEPEALTPLSKS
jgi:anti-anti-sigma factor